MRRRDHLFDVNPFYLLFFIYLLANFYSLITSSFGLPLKVDADEYVFDDATVFITGIALSFSFLAMILFYKAASRATKVRSEMFFHGYATVFLLVLQTGYLCFNYYYEMNIAGLENQVDANTPLGVFFKVMQPDLLFLIIAPGIKSDRGFWLNSAVNAISLLQRSWIGGLFLLAIVVMVRKYPIGLGSKTLKFLFLGLLFGLVALPIVVSAKWFFRSGAGFDEAISYLADFGYFNYMVDSMGYVINRFQQFGHVALLAENSVAMFDAYEADAFTPYWMDGAPQWLLLKLNGVDIFQLNKYMISFFFDSNNLAYATNPGIAGWLFVLREKSIFFAAYLFLITVPPAIFVFRYAGVKYFLLLMCFALIYLFHGWIGAYFNLLIYLLFFIAIKNINFINRYSK